MKIFKMLMLLVILFFPLYPFVNYVIENLFLYMNLHKTENVIGIIEEVDLQYQETVIVFKFKNKEKREYHLLTTKENNVSTIWDHSDINFFYRLARNAPD